MTKKQDVAAHEPVDLTDDAGFMDTGVLYSDQEPTKAENKERSGDADGASDGPGSAK